LIGNGDDFGWHRPDLMKRTAPFQVNKRETSACGTGGIQS
jgi:hypothetical protein